MENFRSVVLLSFVVSLAVSTTGISLPSVHFGRCPKNITVQQNFDAAAYMGVWYEQAGYNTAFTEGGNSRCVSATYALNATSGVVTVFNNAINSQDGTKKGINGTAVLNDPSSKEAKLTVTFRIGLFDVKGMYWVLGTDYSSYSVVYACENLLVARSYTIWLLSREREFSSSAAETSFYESTGRILRANGLDPALLAKSDQANCPA